MVHTNKKLQDKEALDAIIKAVKTGLDPIGYLMIIKNLCFLNQYEQQPIRCPFLTTRQLYKTIQYTKNNTTDYLVRFRNP